MKQLLLVLSALAALALAPVNALAANYIQDNGNMFSQGAKTQATQLIDSLLQRTGKEVVVYTVPSLSGQDAGAAADTIFRSQQINGVLIFASNQDRRLEIKVGQDTRQAISTQRESQIRDTILGDFRANRFDQGLLNGVNAIRTDLLRAAPAQGARAGAAGAPVRETGPNWVFIGLLIVGGLLIVWVIAGIMNARRQQPQFGQPNAQPGYGGGYGQPGFGGPGFGGGGGFFAGLMGGLGGALLGNALFSAFRPQDQFRDDTAHAAGGQDQAGWQGDDAGQVSDSSADSGSWGGGGDVGFGGGDSGGGGGGDW